MSTPHEPPQKEQASWIKKVRPWHLAVLGLGLETGVSQLVSLELWPFGLLVAGIAKTSGTVVIVLAVALIVWEIVQKTRAKEKKE